MKSAQTLCDDLYRASYSKQRVPGWTSNEKWRDALRRAKKFVLDDEMSVFLGELATAAFTRDKLTLAGRTKVIEHLRMGARLPGEIVWVEYNLQKSMQRSNEILGRPFDPTQTPEKEGWLLMRHPKIETAFIAHIVTRDEDGDHGDGFDTWTFPVAMAWTCDMDTVLPWRPIPLGPDSSSPSEVCTGLIGYKTDRAGIVLSDLLQTPNAPKAIAELLREWIGVQRRMWALFACINDLPVLVKEVRASRGFMGARNYRKFLDHKTVTLNVPQALYRKTIRDALAMAHRRGGPVRGHFRNDWRNPLSPLCDHDFTADEKRMECKTCKGKKIWIRDFIRGDSSRGFATTDFRVTHTVENDTTT